MPFKYKNKIFVYASFYYQTELEQKQNNKMIQ